MVKIFKFPGVNINNNLSWTKHVETTGRKAHQWLNFLKRLREFRMSPTTLTNIDRCTIARILSRCIIAWFGNSSVQDGKKLQLPWKSSQCNQGPLTSHSFASPPPSGKTSKVHIQIQLLSHRYQITKRSSYKLKLQSRFPNFHCGSCTFFFCTSHSLRL